MTKSWNTDPDPLNRPLHVPLRLVLRHVDQPASEKCHLMNKVLNISCNSIGREILRSRKIKILPPFHLNWELPPFSIEICWYLFPFHQNWDLNKKPPDPVDRSHLSCSDQKMNSSSPSMNEFRSLLWWAVCNGLPVYLFLGFNLGIINKFGFQPSKEGITFPFQDLNLKIFV